MHRRTFLIAIGAGGLLAAVSAMAAPAVADSPAGTPGNGASSQAAVSTTGRYVVFRSVATNLVSGDTNGKADIFIRDRVANTTKRVSVTSGGAQANADSSRPSVSWDGRYVVFLSAASNLVPGDTNGKVDAYRKDLATGRLVRINTSAAGAQANAAADTVRVSADGNRIVFATTASNLVAGDNRPGDVFLRDMAAGALKRITEAVPSTQDLDNDYGVFADISPNGQISTFSTFYADPAFPGHYCGQAWVWSAGTGRSVVKATKCDDPEASRGYPQVYALNDGFALVLHDGMLSEQVLVTRPAGYPSFTVRIDADCGRDVSGWGKAVVRDCAGQVHWIGNDGQTTIVAPGKEPGVSDDGLSVAYIDTSGAPSKWNQIRVWDRRTGTSTLISQR